MASDTEVVTLHRPRSSRSSSSRSSSQRRFGRRSSVRGFDFGQAALLPPTSLMQSTSSSQSKNSSSHQSSSNGRRPRFGSNGQLATRGSSLSQRRSSSSRRRRSSVGSVGSRSARHSIARVSSAMRTQSQQQRAAATAALSGSNQENSGDSLTLALGLGDTPFLLADDDFQLNYLNLSPLASTLAFDESFESGIDTAIAANVELQEKVSDELEQLKKCLERNEAMQKLVDEVEPRRRRKRKSSLPPARARVGSSYFYDGESSPHVPETAQPRRGRRYPDAHYRDVRPFTDKESKKLLQGVTSHLKRKVTETMLPRQGATSGSELLLTSAAIEKMPFAELARRGGELDFETIAQMYLPDRTPEECALHYKNNLSPLYERKKWTKAEDAELLKLVKAHNECDWIAIANELGGRRLPWQCFERYQRSLTNNLVRTKWTDDEDAQLRELVQQYGTKNWSFVSLHMDRRTGPQCLHRWFKSLHPEIQRGRWTADEDWDLILAVVVFGEGNWAKISEAVPTRTDVQCRERWTNVLSAKISNNKWTKAEDAKLMAVTARVGAGKWQQIAKEMGNRTDNQVWRRWRAIADKDDVEAHLQSVRKTKGLKTSLSRRAHEPTALTTDELLKLAGAEPTNSTPPTPSASSTRMSPPPRTTKRARKKKTTTTTTARSKGKAAAVESRIELLPPRAHTATSVVGGSTLALSGTPVASFRSSASPASAGRPSDSAVGYVSEGGVNTPFINLLAASNVAAAATSSPDTSRGTDETTGSSPSLRVAEDDSHESTSTTTTTTAAVSGGGVRLLAEPSATALKRLLRNFPLVTGPGSLPSLPVIPANGATLVAMRRLLALGAEAEARGKQVLNSAIELTSTPTHPQPGAAPYVSGNSRDPRAVAAEALESADGRFVSAWAHAMFLGPMALAANAAKQRTKRKRNDREGEDGGADEDDVESGERKAKRRRRK